MRMIRPSQASELSKRLTLAFPPADIDLARIGDLLDRDLAAFLKNVACDGEKAP
jgi:hypothetical protein